MFDHASGDVLNRTKHGEVLLEQLLDMVERDSEQGDTRVLSKKIEHLKENRQASHESKDGHTDATYHDITHMLHLGSLTILSLLVFEVSDNFVSCG